MNEQAVDVKSMCKGHGKRDKWEVYDNLPLAVRAALQEGPEGNLCPICVWNLWKRSGQNTEGVASFVRRIAKAQAVNPPGVTMQTSGRRVIARRSA